MNEDYHPPNKQALLDVIQGERSKLMTLLAGLSQEQKEIKGVESDWSIKDIMAHISAWERLAQDRIHAALTEEDLKIPVIEGDDFVDVFNAQVYEREKEAPLSEVEAEFVESYDTFLNTIKSLDEAFLYEKLPFDWAGDLTAQVLISANTHWHYTEHGVSIQEWLSSTSL
jgi:hypothetical protein